MPLSVVPLPFKPHRLDGLTDRLIISHYENNYGGAVRRLNAIEGRLAALDWASAPVFEVNGLKREELIAMNSMILHEVYFDGLGEGRGDPAGELGGALERDFGSVARWKAEFTAMAKAQGGGSGWTLLTWSPRSGRLVNAWAADHTHGIADGVPILALDMYEHAYHLDFGAKAAVYVEAVMRNIAWARVAARHARAVAAAPISAAPSPVDAHGDAMITAGELKADLDGGKEVVVLDVCLREDLSRTSDRLPRSRWCDPETVAEWASELPRGAPVVAYCLYGFQVSQNAAAELRRCGVDARSLAGGIAAWRASGYPTEAKA
jgi:superoxide dismutase, Fe-Mn family